MIDINNYLDKKIDFLFNESTMVLTEEEETASVNSLQKLHALLVAYQYNFRVLHWKSVSNNFDGTHILMSDYYEKLEEFIDGVAEILLIKDINPLSLEEISKLNDVEVSTGEDYTRKDCIEKTNEMFGNLISAFEDSLSGLPDDVQDELKVMIFYLRKEKDYKGKARTNKGQDA